MKASWIIQGDPKPNGKCPSKRRERRHRHIEKAHVTTRAETGVVWPQAKGCLGPSEAGRGKGLPLSTFGGARS